MNESLFGGLFGDQRPMYERLAIIKIVQIAQSYDRFGRFFEPILDIDRVRLEDVECEKIPGRGSRFFFTLPAAIAGLVISR